MPFQTTFPFEGSIANPTAAAYWDRYLAMPVGVARCPISGLAREQIIAVLETGSASAEIKTLVQSQSALGRTTTYYHAGDLLEWIDRDRSSRNDTSARE